MSKSVHKDKVEPKVRRNRKRSQEDIAAAVEQLDATLKQLCERTIPPQPYLLSVPSDVPYLHSSRFVNTWYIGTPFSPEEEQLQYLSFLNQGEEGSLLKVVGGWADEQGNLLGDEAASPASQSGQRTPVEQTNRKKISLKDYKIKDKTRPSTPTTKAPVEELRKQVMKSEAKEHAHKADGSRYAARPNENVSVKVEKRGASAAEKPQLDGSRSPPSLTGRREDAPGPRKRRRLSVESLKRDMTPTKPEKKQDTEDSKDLPLLLSPTLPARQRDASRKGLPGLLLPNLPPALEKLIALADEKVKLEPDDGLSRTDEVKSNLVGALGSTAVKRPPDKVATNVNANRVRSDSQMSSKSAAGTPKVQSPATKPSFKTLPRPATPLQNGVSASPKPRQRHIVALRYGKKNRKRVEALLRITPRIKKPKVLVDESSSKPSELKAVSTKTGTEIDRLEKRRATETSPERPVKKVKQLETPEKSRLSAPSATKSPATAAVTSKPKSELLTPQKGLKAPAMKRLESQDGVDARTPQTDRGRVSTPVQAASATLAKDSPGPSSSISKEDRAGWQQLNTKCFALGRTLKHEGTALGPSVGKERTEKDQALSVILLIEALLCFMINHAAQSQAKPSIDPGWTTILPYHIFVFRASRKYRHLHGLVIQLGAICRQAIHNHNIERLAREPLPFDHCESAPTPGSDGNTRQNEDVEKVKKKYIVFRDQLVLNARELQSAWLEGSRFLSPMLIEREYPKTWAKRTKDTSKRGIEKLKPNAIGRDYFLPLDIGSTAFEATRFSMSFLKEWSEKEKVDWKPRVEL